MGLSSHRRHLEHINEDVCFVAFCCTLLKSFVGFFLCLRSPGQGVPTENHRTAQQCKRQLQKSGRQTSRPVESPFFQTSLPLLVPGQYRVTSRHGA